VQSFDSPLDEPVVNAVQQVAATRGIGMAQVLAWLRSKPVVLLAGESSMSGAGADCGDVVAVLRP